MLKHSGLAPGEHELAPYMQSAVSRASGVRRGQIHAGSGRHHYDSASTCTRGDPEQLTMATLRATESILDLHSRSVELDWLPSYWLGAAIGTWLSRSLAANQHAMLAGIGLAVDMLEQMNSNLAGLAVVNHLYIIAQQREAAGVPHLPRRPYGRPYRRGACYHSSVFLFGSAHHC